MAFERDAGDDGVWPHCFATLAELAAFSYHMKFKYILVTVLVLAAACVFAMPYLTVNQMRVAARERDANALAAHIEFPSVRQSFKDQFKAVIDSRIFPQSKDNALARLGAGVATALVDGAIDFMVTPAGIQKLMSGAKPYEEADGARRNDSQGAEPDEPFAAVTRHYESPNRFVATVETDDGDAIDFVLHRRGLSWKLAEIRLPLQADAR